MTEEIDLFAPTFRHRIPFTEELPDGTIREGRMECSLPLDATADQIASAEKSMWEAHEQVRAFYAQPYEDQLKHYLRIATDALTKIMNDGRFDVREWDREPTKELVQNLRKRIVDAGCEADMALIQIPRKLRSVKNDS